MEFNFFTSRATYSKTYKFTKSHHGQFAKKLYEICKPNFFLISVFYLFTLFFENTIHSNCKAKVYTKRNYATSTAVVARRCSVKNMFLKISQNSWENTCVGLPFLNSSFLFEGGIEREINDMKWDFNWAIHGTDTNCLCD